jgi:hypothetical protein
MCLSLVKQPHPERVTQRNTAAKPTQSSRRFSTRPYLNATTLRPRLRGLSTSLKSCGNPELAASDCELSKP